MSIQALPYVVTLGVVFGTTLLASRFSTGQLEPTTYISIRMLVASVLGWGVLLLRVGGRRVPRDPALWRKAAFLGTIGTALPMSSIVTSMQYQSSGMTSIMLTTGPAITVVLAHFFLPEEQLTRRKVFGVLLALGGAAFLALSGESGLPDVAQADPRGYLLVVGAMVIASAFTVYARKHMTDMDGFQVSSVRYLAAALFITPLSFLWVGFDLSHVTSVGWLAIGWAAVVGTFGGFLISFTIVKRFGATPSALVTYVIPIVASLGGWLLLGETITGPMLIGMAIIVSGIVILNQRQPVTPIESECAGD